MVLDGSHVLEGVNSVDYATIHSTAAGSDSWKDYKITAIVKADNSSDAKLAARYQDQDNYYACGLESGGRVWLGKRLGGSWFEFDRAVYDHSGGFYRITYQLVGDNFTCTISKLDGSNAVTLNGSHDTFTSGTVGAVADGVGEFDNIVVTKLG